MNKFLVSIIFLFFSLTSINGEELHDIKVKLFSSYNGKTAMLSAKNGSYFLIAQDQYGNAIDTITKLDSKDKHGGLLYLWLRSGKVALKRNGINLGNYSNIYLRAADKNSTFKVKYSNKKERIYDGSLIINTKNNNLEIINHVDMTSYVAGVVESEVGSREKLELYKVQAILVRTYALRNFDKFIDKGYNLTDDVRSQVYFSKSHFSGNSKVIHRAVYLTRNLIIVGRGNRIIDPVFHSNSGGQTMKSSDVWSYDIPYLKSIKDPYSVQSGSIGKSWKKEISVDAYLEYFYKMAPKYRNNKSYRKAILSLKQTSRKANFIYKDVTIPLKDVRYEFKLRSSYFSVYPHGNKVTLKGKGYGHGVGLSQIGAINMVEKGFTYEQVIKFYYKGVRIVSINESSLAYRKI
ncbi:MAG: SpoIID/LytB domain-containing protein [Flavobacteriales bacterium]|nr:SpoIID/LytB domain-containing protein [Flavobacteriales bacterium]